MSESAELLRMLRRIRRRARALAAVEGAVAGAALGVASLTMAAAVWRATRGGGVSWRLVALGGGAAALVGAALNGLRAISLVRCARLLDAAIDRGGAARDRVLSALSFVDAPLVGAAFARAALGDAVSRARSFAPAFVAPARRPRALTALGGAALALLLVTVWPTRAPGARRDASLSATAAETQPRVRVGADALEAERAEIIAVSDAADAADNVDLRALAREARATVDALGNGSLGRGEALERLTALAASAKESADETEAAQAALKAAGKSLEPTAATRALGRALGGDDPAATARALGDLAARAEASEGPRADIASALGAAAAGLTGAADGGDATSPGRRRLDRAVSAARDGSPDAAREATGARRLERLRRDLEATSAACRADTAACAQRLRDREGALPTAARQASETGARRRLESAVQQVRERLRRGELGEGPRGETERRFARIAQGQGGEPARQGGAPARGASPGGDTQEASGPGEAESEGDGEGDRAGDGAGDRAGDRAGDDVFADETEGAASPSGDAAGAPQAGQGAGREAGGEPLGRGTSTPAARGREREVHVRDGAGPTRSEVIEASARHGFAAGDYVRVFGDYAPVVEESLASGAVPEGRRYVVRRYFQLIRPRAGAARTP